MVGIEKLAVVVPPFTVTNGGTDALGSPLNKFTISPPGGAAIASVTVPTELVPPTTVVGFKVRLLIGTVFTCVPTA